MQIDPKSHKPIFRQIADQVRGKIHRGVHRPGEALPSLRQLAVEIKVNPNTVQRAYELLEREGVIESRRGVGVFVSTSDSQPSGTTEQDVQQKLEKLVDAAVSEGVSLARLRTLFDNVLQARQQDHVS